MGGNGYENGDGDELIMMYKMAVLELGTVTVILNSLGANCLMPCLMLSQYK